MPSSSQLADELVAGISLLREKQVRVARIARSRGINTWSAGHDVRGAILPYTTHCGPVAGRRPYAARRERGCAISGYGGRAFRRPTAWNAQACPLDIVPARSARYIAQLSFTLQHCPIPENTPIAVVANAATLHAVPLLISEPRGISASRSWLSTARAVAQGTKGLRCTADSVSWNQHVSSRAYS